MNNRLFSRQLVILVCLTLSGAVQAVTCWKGIPPTHPDSVYATDPIAGTVTDTRTGLMWKTCVEGQSWDGATCSGTANRHTWATALEQAEASTFAGYEDWRLPNIKELRSLVESCRRHPAINDTAFPNTPQSAVWSGSPFAYYSGLAWFVDFGDGYAYYYSLNRNYRVRLVRGGQSSEIFDLTVSKAGTGRGTVTSALAGISCGDTCSADFASDTPITLTAEPSSGSTFGGWSGCNPNPQNDAQCTLILTADTSISAMFGAATAHSDVAITLTPANPAANGLFDN